MADMVDIANEFTEKFEASKIADIRRKAVLEKGVEGDVICAANGLGV